MPIVSISEAARLVNKSRKTIYKHIHQGTLSTVTTVDGSKGIDTSELIRVYGSLKIQKETPVTYTNSKQKYTKSNTDKETPVTINNHRFIELEKELALSKLRLEQQDKELNYKQQIIDAKEIALSSKQETIDSLKVALKLLEHRQEKDTPLSPKEEQTTLEPSENTPADPIEITEPSKTGFWNGFKKLFQ
ncbi:hypothetical protein [Commensalibacter nepenthis]|uniref:DNA-binding protein n=1 Tax=Commensalibacter nepenthis TaxID=3043872 RepID=A0ABT6QAS5_9PROT|nr:hypothetical protein [Commensalibacter sp. TBRC 10068]MDI2113909.1 hypothetical protein [Commensalibacter sp. TBRC 10068]